MDRGHRHSDGKSEITFWLSVSNALRAPRRGDDGPPPGDDGADNDGGPCRTRSRRGRSPPGPGDNSDPWQSPGGDPWGSATIPVRKAPRQRQVDIAAPSPWSSWLTTSNTVTSASITPDPPTFRRNARVVWLPRRTEPPPLVVTDASDPRFDPWCCFNGMASYKETVAGATLLRCECIDDVPEGDSLLNQMHEKREVHSRLVAWSVSESSSEDWRLKVDDIVYVGEEARPSIVIRIGYDSYEREVRVAGIRENRNLRTTGRWVRTDHCHVLETDDELKATANIEDSSEERRLIPIGSLCRFIGQDDDGDVVIRCGCQRFIIFADDLEHFSLQ